MVRRLGVYAAVAAVILCLALDTEALPLPEEEQGGVTSLDEVQALQGSLPAPFLALLQREALPKSSSGPCIDTYDKDTCMGASKDDGCQLSAVKARCARTCGLCGEGSRDVKESQDSATSELDREVAGEMAKEIALAKKDSVDPEDLPDVATEEDTAEDASSDNIDMDVEEAKKEMAKEAAVEESTEEKKDS